VLVKVTLSNVEHSKGSLHYILWIIETVFKQKTDVRKNLNFLIL